MNCLLAGIRFLLMVEPHSLAITGLYGHCGSGNAGDLGLRLCCSRKIAGCRIQGLAEDGCISLRPLLQRKPAWLLPFKKDVLASTGRCSAKSFMMWNGRPCRS